MTLIAGTWNTMDTHGDPSAAAKAALDMGVMIFCLQEVPRQALLLLYDSREYDVVAMPDFNNADQMSYLVILVHKSIKMLRKKKYKPKRQGRRPLFAKAMGWSECLGSLSVLVKFQGQKIRILNCHAPFVSSLLARRSIVDRIFGTHRCRNPLIVCADLNMVGFRGYNAICGRILGIDFAEILINEIDHVDWLSEKYGLRRALGKEVVTYPLLGDFLGGQPDQILVDDRLPVYSGRVHPERHGSDHHPFIAEIGISGLARI